MTPNGSPRPAPGIEIEDFGWTLIWPDLWATVDKRDGTIMQFCSRGRGWSRDEVEQTCRPTVQDLIGREPETRELARKRWAARGARYFRD